MPSATRSEGTRAAKTTRDSGAKYVISFLCIVKMKGYQTHELAPLLIAHISTASTIQQGCSPFPWPVLSAPVIERHHPATLCIVAMAWRGLV
jgi:hypothetical protein